MRWRASCASLCCGTETGTHSAFLGRRCLGNAVALWRLVKEFHTFSKCSRCLLGIWTLFPEPLVSGSHLPLCVATVHGCSWTNFVFFLREKWTRISLQFTLGNLELFLQTVSGSLRVRQSTVLLEEFHIFSTCWLSRFLAQFALENLDIISICSHMAVGRGF